MSDLSSPQIARHVAEVVAQHCTDVVICPGSRNSPLTMELLARRDLRVHMRIDERSASFLALGMGRVQRRPVPVVMTSGTAVANCLPAMVEAAHAHVPFVVLSADRPAHLVGRGVSQTIEQPGLFEPWAKTITIDDFAAELPARAHINVPLDVPLLGELPEPVGTPGPRFPKPVTHWVDHGEVTVDLSKNTLVIAGDEAWEVPGLEEVPTIAEPTAPTPYYPVHPLAAQILAPLVEQVIVVGHPTLHRPVMGLVDNAITLTRTETATNPSGEATVATRVRTTGEPTQQWRDVCAAAGDVGAQAVREVLEDSQYGLTGLHVAAAVADTVAVGDAVFISASNPIRDASFAGFPLGGVTTISPRGAAGIDGTISQAIGVALAHQAAQPDQLRAPRTVALTGDLSFLHDVGGLLIGPHEKRPENLTIVVANDDGGGIFETLEIGGASYRDVFERGFGTPTGVDIAPLCAAYGVDYQRVENLQDLLLALENAAETGGYQVIEVPCRRDTRRAMHEALNTRLRGVAEDAAE